MLPSCPGCGYNLTGLLPPVGCPECGFTVDDKTMVLYGVLKTDATQSPIRKVLWGIIIVVGVIILYAWFVLVLLGWFGLVLLLAWLAGFIAMITTSKRDRSGKMALVFTAGGFVPLAELHDPRHESQPMTWDRVGGIKLNRISPVWYRLEMWSATQKLLDAGIRCPDAHAKLVYDTLEAYRTGKSADEV